MFYTEYILQKTYFSLVSTPKKYQNLERYNYNKNKMEFSFIIKKDKNKMELLRVLFHLQLTDTNK